jgi:hypothetical protein
LISHSAYSSVPAGAFEPPVLGAGPLGGADVPAAAGATRGAFVSKRQRMLRRLPSMSRADRFSSTWMVWPRGRVRLKRNFRRVCRSFHRTLPPSRLPASTSVMRRDVPVRYAFIGSLKRMTTCRAVTPVA